MAIKSLIFLSLFISCSFAYPIFPLLESEEKIKPPSTINKFASIHPNYRSKRQIVDRIQFPGNWQQNYQQGILRQEEIQIKRDEQKLLQDEERLRLEQMQQG